MDTGKRVVRKFGKRLRQLRKAKGWSQQELASMLEVEQSYVSAIETGVFGPSFIKLARLAEAFGITIAELCSSL